MQPKRLIKQIEQAREGGELENIYDSQVDITALPGVETIKAQTAQGSASHLKLMLELVTALVGQDDLSDASTIEDQLQHIDKNIKPRLQIHRFNILYSRLKRMYGGIDPWSPDRKVAALMNMHSNPTVLHAMFHEHLQEQEKDWRRMPWDVLQTHYISTANKMKLMPPGSPLGRAAS